ncbi:MAG: J domain-containing protein, partial [Candidatus Omnitrophota bacterium]
MQPNTSAEDIKKAFRALALRWHPDRHPAAAKVFAQRKFIEIAEAYQILGNEVCRHQYDALYTPRRSRSPAAHATEKTRRRMSQWQAMAAQRAVQMARASFGRFSEAVDLVSQRVSKGVFDFLEFFADKDPYACEIESCRDQIRKDPRDADQYYGLGFLHYKRGDFKKAAENYKRALLLNYDDADAFFGLGVVRHQM